MISTTNWKMMKELKFLKIMGRVKEDLRICRLTLYQSRFKSNNNNIYNLIL